MRRVLLAAGATCLFVASLPVLTAQAAAENGSELGSWGLAAAAPGVELKFGEPTYCFVTPSGLNGCEGVVPEATSQLQNGPIGSATAAIAWPGSLASNLGSLIITAGGSQVPPQATVLNDPVRAEAKTGSNPDTVTNTSVPNVSMKAVARPLLTSADSLVNGFSAASVGSIGSIKGTTETAVIGPKLVRSKATSVVSDINLLAGVVQIGSVTSTAEATSDGVAAHVKGSTAVNNATVGGVPVTIDENGVSVQGSGVGLTAATAAVNAALSGAGMTLLVSEPQGKPNGSDVTYTAGSLVAVFKPQAGYQVSLTLGGANVTASASPGYSFTQPTVPTTPGVTSPGGSGSVPGTTNPGTGSTGLTPGTGGTVIPPITDPGTPGTATTPTRPVLAAEHARLGSNGVSPWLAGFGLLGAGLMLAGMRRLPDRILEVQPSVCPLEETA